MATTAIHDQPGAGWTLGDLARHASMSRTSYARRFHELVGEPPISYLTRWRMYTASRELRDTGQPVGDIANRVGYRSEVSFTRAFRKMHRVTPSAYRRARRGAPR